VIKIDVARLSELPRWRDAADRLRPRLPRRALSSAALVVYGVTLALLIGLGSAYWAVKDTYPFGTVRASMWIAAPRVGSREVDPYAKAVVARSAEIPLATGEGLVLTATGDEGGHPLDSQCTYRIGLVTPQARYWTLTLYDDDGRPAASDLQRSGFTSAEVLREADGRFTITISREPMPGNWLKMPERGRPSVVLRLYDTPVAAGSAALDPRTLPVIERLGCPS
jgi:hypothetical protein